MLFKVSLVTLNKYDRDRDTPSCSLFRVVNSSVISMFNGRDSFNVMNRYIMKKLVVEIVCKNEHKNRRDGIFKDRIFRFSQG